MVLARLQSLLGRINDVEPPLDIRSFLVTNPADVAGWRVEDGTGTDETLFVHEDGDCLEMALYVNGGVLERLEASDPFERINESNLQDCCTAVEGVSHLLYFAWSALRGRPVSLLELETQAEVDKFAAMLVLAGARGPVEPDALLYSLFERVRFAEGLDRERRERYENANRFAARFCRRLANRWLGKSGGGHPGLFRDLRAFYRLPHARKLACAAH